MITADIFQRKYVTQDLYMYILQSISYFPYRETVERLGIHSRNTHYTSNMYIYTAMVDVQQCKGVTEVCTISHLIRNKMA